MNTKEKIVAEVLSITYRNEVNYYTVAEVLFDKEKLTVVGILPFLNEGDTAEFYGTYIFHPTYGRQFKAESFERRAPQNIASILRYLSSGAIKGIGPSTASKIVEKFGENSLDIILEEPEALATIKGISMEKARQISSEYEKQYGARDIMMLLSKYSISPNVCINIYKRFGSNSSLLIQQNPYILCEQGIDIDFETVEDMAADYAIPKENEFRIAAGLEYILRRNLNNGHTCLPKSKFIETAAKLLECGINVAEDACYRLIECFRFAVKIIDSKEYISLPEYYYAEEYIAARLCAVKRNMLGEIPPDSLEIDFVENKLGIKFEEMQRKAITEAFENGVLILTGGPGTGKTTTLNAIISLFESRELEIQLAAPTGRAAKRITELTGREAMTIHRLLEVEWGSDDNLKFSRNERNPLTCQVLIVDEISMVDAIVFEKLLKALKLSCRIILVGDADQLPSIGAGNILSDILNSDIFPSIRLNKVFRQANESLIVTNAHSIINNEKIDFARKDSDFFLLKRNDNFSVIDTVLQLCCDRIPTAYGFDPLKDIQVLCPSRKLDTGTVNFNNLLQERLNPRKKKQPQLCYKGFFYRVGDKVMQTKNNYDLQYKKDNGEYSSGIFNGDVGFITEIDVRASTMNVRFDDKTATYFAEEIGQLEPAYAITVHKSQGSEFDCVIIPLFNLPTKLKYRNLLYTAVTRAKKLLIVVGSEREWQDMVDNDRKTLRYTMLKEFLRENNFENS